MVDDEMLIGLDLARGRTITRTQINPTDLTRTSILGSSDARKTF